MDLAYRSPSLADSQASPMLNNRETDDDTVPPKPRRAEEPEEVSLPKTLIIQLFALAWVAPIGVLLYFNLKTHILGASAWCPSGHCKPRIYSEDSDTLKLRAAYERSSHNVLGSLQFAAKALEIWFILIATWLVYLRTIHLAQRSEGLPIGYLSRPSEFAEIPSLFDKRLWTTLCRSSRTRRARMRLWLFIFSTMGLCVLANLMGPAVAVLVLPSLQWIETKNVVLERFSSFNANNPPYSAGFAHWNSRCLESEFKEQQYSCSADNENSMDSWVEATFASQGRSTPVASLQSDLSFSYNSTWIVTSNLTYPNGTHQTNLTIESVTWSPSRQMVQQLNDDLIMIVNMSAGGPGTDPRGENPSSTFNVYNNTVSTTIRRKGPILGAMVNTWIGYNDTEHTARHYTIELGWQKSVRCYANYNLVNTPNCWGECEGSVNASYTRCITIGAGWGDGYKRAKFTVSGRYLRLIDDLGPEASFKHLASGHAAYLPGGKIPDDVLAANFSKNCLDSNTVNQTFCNWDAFFNMTTKTPRVAPRSKLVNTLQIDWDMRDIAGKPNTITFAIDFVVFQTFADYLLNPDELTNPLLQIDTQIRQDQTWGLHPLVPIAIDPAWTLAAWAVAPRGVIDVERSAASRLQRLVDLFYQTPNSSDQDYNLFEERWWLNSIAFMPIMQTLSLIEFDTLPATADEDDSDPAKLLLKRNARVYVWAYNISSRTGYFGIAVVSCGIVVVLLEVYLGMRDRRIFRSPTQLLVAALEHPNAGEFHGWNRDRDISRVSFRLQNDRIAAGRLRFEKT